MNRLAKNRNPLGVIFDMDGLMLESEGIWNEVDMEVTARLGVRFDPSLKHLFMGCERVESARRFCEAYGVAESPERVADMRSELAARLYKESVALMPGVTELVGALVERGKRLAVATSAERGILDIAVSRFDVFGRFEAIVCADEVKRGKPAPDLFIEAARRLRLKSDTCLVLEDSPNGVTAALSAGMKVVGVPNPHIVVGAISAATKVFASISEVTPEVMEELYL
ncbi:MAG: HAD family hydrolase [Myxococcota bacterium]